MIRLRALIAAVAALVLATSAALASEVIEYFGSDVSVRSDGTVYVEETIRVRAEGAEIRHGIFRELSVTPFGGVPGYPSEGAVRFLKVTRDGKAEPYHVKRLNDILRLYAGEADVLLDPGTYTYVLVYEADGRVRRSDGRLLWEVTGGWSFPIEELRFHLRVPGNTMPSDWIATLTHGSLPVEDNGAWEKTNEQDGVGLRTLRPLQPGEGIVVGARVFVPT